MTNAEELLRKKYRAAAVYLKDSIKHNYSNLVGLNQGSNNIQRQDNTSVVDNCAVAGTLIVESNAVVRNCVVTSGCTVIIKQGCFVINTEFTIPKNHDADVVVVLDCDSIVIGASIDGSIQFGKCNYVINTAIIAAQNNSSLHIGDGCTMSDSSLYTTVDKCVIGKDFLLGKTSELLLRSKQVTIGDSVSVIATALYTANGINSALVARQNRIPGYASGRLRSENHMLRLDTSKNNALRGTLSIGSGSLLITGGSMYSCNKDLIIGNNCKVYLNNTTAYNKGLRMHHNSVFICSYNHYRPMAAIEVHAFGTFMLRQGHCDYQLPRKIICGYKQVVVI